MSTLNLNANINGAKRGLPYPTAGLDVIVYNSTYEDGGTTYYRTSKGIGLPVISGTGLDTIIDFAPLNDVRFDKGSYVGNAYGLPETYNFPYVGIYYDATLEATRYYWKITDFAYAVILAQSLLVDNMFFLKARATTNTSNIIATWDKLFIYSTALSGLNLAKMKTYIGIQDDFYGDELAINNNISAFSIRPVVDEKTDTYFITSTVGGVTLNITIGKVYRIMFNYVTTSTSLGLWQGSVAKVVAFLPSPSGAFDGFIIAEQTYIYLRHGNPGRSDFSNVSVKEYFQNYYKQ